MQASWELDLFGRVRRQSEAAFAQYLATEQGQRAVLVTLVGDVASSYLLLRQLDLELEIAQQTVVSNEETVRFYQNRLKGGLSNRLELDTAIANLARTNTLIPQLELQVAVTENTLSLLLGRPPGPIERGEPLASWSVAARHLGGCAGGTAGAAPGCSGGGAATGSGQCQRGRSQGPVFPENFADRPFRHRQR